MSVESTPMHRMSSFFRDEDGAVTVDWVVITAACVGIAIAVTTTVGTGTHDYGETMGDFMSTQGVKTSF